MEPAPTEQALVGPPVERVDEFVRLLGQNQRRIFLYVLSLVPRWSDAEEIVQETNLLLWREFGRFTSGTNFAAWGCRVAFHQVLAWRKRKQRDRLEFSDAVLEVIGEEAIGLGDELDERAAALAHCLEELPAHHRELIRLRYNEGQGVEAIAVRQERTAEAIYRALSRVRQALYTCITRNLGREELP
jgi:RNA polymerase sigma-70 factor (ECF subfamily)